MIRFNAVLLNCIAFRQSYAKLLKLYYDVADCLHRFLLGVGGGVWICHIAAVSFPVTFPLPFINVLLLGADMLTLLWYSTDFTNSKVAAILDLHIITEQLIE